MTRRSGPASEQTGPSARALGPGSASAEAIVLDEPLSLWGGMDPDTGTVIDGRHPQAGAELRGRVVVMPWGRGSSSSSAVLAEAIRSGSGPAGIVLLRADPILALGSIVAGELYGVRCPVVTLEPEAYAAIATGDLVTLEASEPGGPALCTITPRGSR